MGRTPSLELVWFECSLEARNDQEGEQKTKLEQMQAIGMGDVINLGVAQAPLPLVDWLGFLDQIVFSKSYRKGEGENSDKIITSNLSSAHNIELVFVVGTKMRSGNVAAGNAKKGEEINLQEYDVTQFSIGFPGQLVDRSGKILFPSEDKKDGKERGKGISIQRFEAWMCHLPEEKFKAISEIRKVSRSKPSKTTSRFRKLYEQKNPPEGSLLPEGQFEILDAEIISALELPPKRQLILPGGVELL